jgi:hypothetical protein
MFGYGPKSQGWYGLRRPDFRVEGATVENISEPADSAGYNGVVFLLHGRL